MLDQLGTAGEALNDLTRMYEQALGSPPDLDALRKHTENVLREYEQQLKSSTESDAFRNFVQWGDDTLSRSAGSPPGPDLADLLRALDDLASTFPPARNSGPVDLLNSGTSFTAAVVQPIYVDSVLAGYRGQSAAGIEGFAAVPWLSRFGTGVSSAGLGLSAAPGGQFQTLNYANHYQVYIQVQSLQLAGRFEEARQLIQMYTPAQFGGMMGAAENAAYYLGIVQAFIGGDPTVAAAVFGNENVLGLLSALTGLSPEEVMRQLAQQGIDGLIEGTLRGSFFLRTAAGDVIGIGGLGLIRGQLVWMNNADLDLHLILPGGAGTVFYANSSITFNGGGALAELDHDNLGGVIDAPPNLRVENITVTGSNIPAGDYNFFVHNFSANSNPTTDFTLTLTNDGGETVQQFSGSLTNNQQTGNFTVNLPVAGSFP